jgi:hypothetical protein
VITPVTATAFDRRDIVLARLSNRRKAGLSLCGDQIAQNGRISSLSGQ